MSHKIRSGILAKKTWKDADLFKMFHELTPPQMSFFRECVVQELGGKKSAFWGHQRIPFKIKHNCSKKDLLFFLEALNHPTHVFARKMSINKNAAGFGASVGRAVVKVGRTVGKYAAKGAKWMAAHAKQIMGGLDTAIGLGVQGVTMAYQMGALDDESDATLLGLTQAVGMAHQLYHAGDGEEKKEEKTTEKTGKGIEPNWVRAMKKEAKVLKQNPSKSSLKQGKGGWVENAVKKLDHNFHKPSAVQARARLKKMSEAQKQQPKMSLLEFAKKNAQHPYKQYTAKSVSSSDKGGGHLDFGVEQSKPAWLQVLDKGVERKRQYDAMAAYRSKHQIKKKSVV